MNFSATWTWIKAQGPMLLVIERMVVTIAALVALFPLWQYWEEREDRKIDRAANFVQTLLSCAELNENYPHVIFEDTDTELLVDLNKVWDSCVFLQRLNISKQTRVIR